jgi:uncharacterized protein YggE
MMRWNLEARSLVRFNNMRRFIMKKSGLVVTGLLLMLVLLVAGCNSASSAPPLFSALAGGSDQSGDIIWSQQNVGLWITGEGKASGAPDVANIVLGVQVQETSVAVAQREGAEAMDKIIKVLKSKSVADKDIQTQQFNIQMVTRWIDKENREEIIGYRVMNTVVAKIRKVSEAGSVIDAVAVAGGNVTRINSISFTVDDPAPYYKEARDKAVANAIAKAKQIASTAGVKLGKPISITENVGYVPSPVIRNYMKADAAAAAAPTPISAGELEFQINVQIVYAIE